MSALTDTELRCGWCHQNMTAKPSFDCKNPMHSGLYPQQPATGGTDE